tara:strand:+ start:149 stop:322 length:174 start_codon:yes stop_codon:yes gene_type:complete
MNKKPTNEQKSTNITIRIRAQDRAKLEDIARLNELSLGNVIRGLVSKANPKETITKD